jgi:signal transduction histidine kinase
MRAIRRSPVGTAVVLVVAVGVIGTGVTALVLGMGSELGAVARALVPGAILTICVAVVTARLLSRASLRVRFIAVATVAASVAIANVLLLSRRMFVSEHDAALISVVMLFAVSAGIAAALAVAQRLESALRSIASMVDRLGAGDLTARTGALDAGPELDSLSRTLDEMAVRLETSRSTTERAEAVRRDLITAVSHDLRTPMASLRAMIEAIDEGVVDDPSTVRRYIEEMRRSVEQLVVMVDDLFELVQLDAGAIAAEANRIAFGDAVDSAMSAIAVQAREKGISLVTDLTDAANVPCSPRLVRVLQNLLSNAVRHTPADGTVTLEACRRGDTLAVAVEDTGRGIAPQDRMRIFEPFYRGDPSRSGPGAGLGLALAKRIVEGLGGEIGATERDGGARFELSVPTGHRV